MAAVAESSSAPECFVFQHNFTFERIAHNENTFITAHGVACYEWIVNWGQEMNWNRNSARKWRLELWIPSFITERTPHPVDVAFEARVTDELGREVLPPVSDCALPRNQGTDDLHFRLEQESPLVQMLIGARDLDRQDGEKLVAEICTQLRLPLSDFEMPARFLNVAAEPPERPDFRFAALFDSYACARRRPARSSWHDLDIVCRDGRLRVSKEALFHASAHLRDQILGLQPGEHIIETASLLAVQQVVAFLLTETFKHDGFLSTAHAAELFELSTKYKPIRRAMLVNAVEQHLVLQTNKSRMDVDCILHHFMLAHKHGLALLNNACMALLFVYHFNDYMAHYSAATVRDAPIDTLSGQKRVEACAHQRAADARRRVPALGALLQQKLMNLYRNTTNVLLVANRT